jgi:hypothetical protein
VAVIALVLIALMMPVHWYACLQSALSIGWSCWLVGWLVGLLAGWFWPVGFAIYWSVIWLALTGPVIVSLRGWWYFGWHWSRVTGLLWRPCDL